MKKILLLAMVSLLASGAFAQGLGFGARISYQSEGMVGDNAKYFADEKVSSGFAAGVGLLYHFNENLALHTDLEFQAQVYSWEDAKIDRGLVFLNLDIPVLARYNFTRGLFAEAGLDMDINMLAKSYYKDPVDDENKYSNLEDWNTFQMGPTVGMGYTLWFGLEFSGRFTYGLLEPGKDADFRPIRFQIDVAYWFLK